MSHDWPLAESVEYDLSGCEGGGEGAKQYNNKLNAIYMYFYNSMTRMVPSQSIGAGARARINSLIRLHKSDLEKCIKTCVFLLHES